MKTNGIQLGATIVRKAALIVRTSLIVIIGENLKLP